MNKLLEWWRKMFERQDYNTGLIPQKIDTRDYRYIAQVVPKNISYEVDLRDKFKPCTYQNGYNSCASHAVCALLDYSLKYKKLYTAWDMNNSEAYLWYFARKRIGKQAENNGTVLRDYFKVVKDVGFVPESIWTYSNGPYIEPDTKAVMGGQIFKLYLRQLKGYYGFTPKSTNLIALLKDSLTLGNPVVFGMPTDDNYKKLTKDNPYVTEIIGNSNFHAQLIVGYFLEPFPDHEETYFIVRNSWGTRWGKEGYSYISAKVIYEKGFDFWTLQ